jgi:hypothetical protein
MTGPVVEGRDHGPPLSPLRAPLRCLHPIAAGYRDLVSTRGLIVAALCCGLAILVAFAVQVALVD